MQIRTGLNRVFRRLILQNKNYINYTKMINELFSGNYQPLSEMLFPMLVPEERELVEAAILLQEEQGYY